jgi:Flp pilus assembly protein TadD
MMRDYPMMRASTTGSSSGRTVRAARRPFVTSTAAIAFLLAVATLAVYAPVLRHGFISYDDPDYVTSNPQVAAGLTPAGALWAFGTWRTGNWHPLTWLSHMLDVSLFGMAPAGHHATSLALHALNTLLLFAFLTRATGSRARSAFVAALFALHPLHVESVAWVAERKDVLSATLGLAALLSWTFQARAAGGNGALPGARGEGRTGVPYAASIVLFALGLLAKPMLVTLPFILLLLDIWPFRRIGGRAGAGPLAASGDRGALPRLVLEKAPFFALAAASSAITFLAQRSGGAVSSLSRWSLGIRIANALVAYVRYLALTLWPAHLAIFYPMPRAVPVAASVAAAAVFLIAASALAVRLARRRPHVTTGWFWYAAMLVPVIGLVKVGGQSMADRYTYLPLIGIFVIVSWGLHDLLGRGSGRTSSGVLFAGIAVAVCVALAAATRAQLAYWRDSETLYTRAIAVTKDNTLAHYNLGCLVAAEGREEEAAAHFTEAIRIDPTDAMARANLGASWFRRGRTDEALRELQEAVRLDPGDAVARASLGTVLIGMGRLQEALVQEQEAVRLRPDLAEGHLNLGVVLGRLGRADDAIREYQEAVRLDPGSADARGNLGAALANRGRAPEALPHLSEAVRLRPGSPSLRANLGNVLLMLNRSAEAAEQYREALRLAPGDPAVQQNLDRALAAPVQGRP